MEMVVALRCVIPRATECPWRAQYPFLGVMARPLLRAVQCARAWHDLTLHTADVEIAHALILIQFRPGSRVRGHPACWVVEVRNLPVATKLFWRFDGIKRCAADF